MPRRNGPVIPDDVLDALLVGGDVASLLNSGGLVDALKKALTEQVLIAEMDHHLKAEIQIGNSHNDFGRKTVATDSAKIEISIPRDHAGLFDPQLMAKYLRRFNGLDDTILWIYARGGTTAWKIAAHLMEIYGIKASAELVGMVTAAVLDEVRVWQKLPFGPVYPLALFDAIRVKIREDGVHCHKLIHIALGLTANGTNMVLGIWIKQAEDDNFWLRVIEELKDRGVADIVLAVVDGLTGFPEALTAVFSETIAQPCMVHLLRSSSDCLSYKYREAVAAEIKDI